MNRILKPTAQTIRFNHDAILSHFCENYLQKYIYARPIITQLKQKGSAWKFPLGSLYTKAEETRKPKVFMDAINLPTP